jgi:hypothetical protein
MNARSRGCPPRWSLPRSGRPQHDCYTACLHGHRSVERERRLRRQKLVVCLADGVPASGLPNPGRRAAQTPFRARSRRRSPGMDRCVPIRFTSGIELFSLREAANQDDIPLSHSPLKSAAVAYATARPPNRQPADLHGGVITLCQAMVIKLRKRPTSVGGYIGG